MDKFEPLYTARSTSSNKMLLGTHKNIGIVTLWTKVADVAKKVDPSKYAIMGQFFSAERGLDLIVRNLLANPDITNLVITGTDFSNSGQVMKDFFENGFVEGKTDLTEKTVWRVKSEYPGYIEKDIPEIVLNHIRDTIVVTRIDDMTNFDPEKLEKPDKKREKQIFLKKEELEENTFVGEDVGYVVRGKRVADTWLKTLDTIMKFGHKDEKDKKEVIDLISIISEEDPEDFHIPEYLPLNRKQVTDYIPQITENERIRSKFGKDQIKEVVDKLTKDTTSKSAVISLWDVADSDGPGINHIWLRIRDNKLYMTATIRSSDMFEEYPGNAFALRALQNIIRKEIQEKISKEIQLGELVINSQSAHIYKDCWQASQDLTIRYLPRHIAGQSNAALYQDPRGSFIVKIKDGELHVDHLSTGNELIGQYKAKTPGKLIERLAQAGVFSIPGHALDIGHEIAKAEIAMQLGIDFVQEVPLDLTQINEKTLERVRDKKDI
ncbi:MAG: thymidylate synthase [Candidatus Aenigmatarchaeota archaeon]